MRSKNRDSQVDDCLSKIWHHINQGQFKRALSLAHRLLLVMPDDEELLIYKANLLWNLSRYDEAMDIIQRLREMGCSDLLAYYTEGRILTSMGKFEQALTVWKSITRRSEIELATMSKGRGKRWMRSVVADSFYYQAICFEELGKVINASEMIRHHLALMEKGIESEFSKKEVARKLKNLQYIQQYNIPCNREIEGYMTPYESERFQRHLDKLKADEKLKTAAKYLTKKAIEYPNEYYIHIELNNVFWVMGRYEKAVRHSTIAYNEANYDPLVVYNLSRDMMCANDNSHSLLFCDKLLEMELDYIAYGPNGEGIMWAKSIINDTKLIKSLCLRHQHEMAEARILFYEHKTTRKKGVTSEFSRGFINNLNEWNKFWCSGREYAARCANGAGGVCRRRGHDGHDAPLVWRSWIESGATEHHGGGGRHCLRTGRRQLRQRSHDRSLRFPVQSLGT